MTPFTCVPRTWRQKFVRLAHEQQAGSLTTPTTNHNIYKLQRLSEGNYDIPPVVTIRRYALSCPSTDERDLNVRPDKKKVIDEVWDDERIDDFLSKAPLGPGEDPDYSAVLYAYRSMRVEDFARFIERFKAQGRNVQALGRNGQTVAKTIETHSQAAPFLPLLA